MHAASWFNRKKQLQSMTDVYHEHGKEECWCAQNIIAISAVPCFVCTSKESNCI